MTANTLETLLAKQDMRDVLSRYARGVDRADGELLASCYHEDAIEEHGNTYTGPAIPYAKGAAERLKSSKQPMAHYVCNSHFEFEENGEVCFVESYVLTFARFENRKGEAYDTLTGGRLFDKFERRDGVWKIAHRKMTLDWNRDQPASETWCLGLFDPEDPRLHIGARGEADLTYSRF